MLAINYTAQFQTASFLW